MYFITTTTDERYPFFENEILCWLFIAQLKLTKILKGFELYAFCILHDHVHLMVKPSDKYNITKIMFSLKKQFAHNANRVLGHNPPTLQEGAQALARLPDTENIEYGMIGNDTPQKKMDKYVYGLRNKYHKETLKLNHPPFKWQKSYHDHIIRSTKDFLNHIDYTAENYKKHFNPDGNVTYPLEYKFTSENFTNMIDDHEI